MHKWLIFLIPLLACCDEELRMGSFADIPVPEYAKEQGDDIDIIEDFEINFDYDEKEEN